MNKCVERVYNGIVKENPTFVMLIGMCPTLAVTTSAMNGIGMGLSTTLVLYFPTCLFHCFVRLFRTVSCTGIYRSRSITGNYRAVLAGRFCSFPVCFTGTLYSSDRSKLYHPWPCRELCI